MKKLFVTFQFQDSEQMDVGVTNAGAECDSVIKDVTVKTVRVPFERERKKSKHLSDPYTPPPATTPRRSRKARPSSRIYKSQIDSFVGEDGSQLVLEEWKEVRIRFYG